MTGYEVLGYYVCNDTTIEEAGPADIFVAIDEGHNRLTVYAPIGQHSEADRGYVKECQTITKEEYKQISKGIYTPAEYL